MKKKIAMLMVICLVVSMALAFTGCETTDGTAESSSAATEEAATEAKTQADTSEVAAADGDLPGAGYEIGVLPFHTGCLWFDPFTAGGKWYLEAKGADVIVENAEWDTMQYNTICNTWATLDDLDAVIAAPLGGEEVATGLKAISDAGKTLVITNNEAGYLPEAIFSVRYDGKEACAGLAEKVIELIQEQKGEVSGVIIMGLGDTKNPEHIERATAMKEVFEQYPDLEIRDFDSGMTAETATTRTADLLRTEDNVIGVVSVGNARVCGHD